MVSLSSVKNTAALSLLKGNTQNSVSNFLNSSIFKVQTSEIFSSISAAFSSDTIQKQYTAAFKAEMDAGSISGSQSVYEDNARHNALTTVMMSNRAKFPPEEFTVHTDLPGGGSITSTIPSLISMKGDLFAADVAKKQAAFNAAIAQENAEPDPELVKINAMAQVVKTLVVDGPEADAAKPLLTETELNPGRAYKEEAGSEKAS